MPSPLDPMFVHFSRSERGEKAAAKHGLWAVAIWLVISLGGSLIAIWIVTRK